MAIPEISSYLPPYALNAVKTPVSNPILQPAPVPQPFVAKREVEYVSGFDGANSVLMGPNSSGLFLDKDENVLWVIATDQNGSKTLVKGYHIGEEYSPPKPVTLEDLMAQMKSMNERLNKMEESSNGQLYNKPAGQGRSNGADGKSSLGNSQNNAVAKPDGGANRPG